MWFASVAGVFDVAAVGGGLTCRYAEWGGAKKCIPAVVLQGQQASFRAVGPGNVPGCQVTFIMAVKHVELGY